MDVRDVTIDHPTDRPNFTRVTVDGMWLWFSYSTLVAVNICGRRFVRENEWGPTTGKHLNYIDDGDKASRLSYADFQAAIDVHTAG